MLTLACALLLALQGGRPEAAEEAAAPLLAPGSWSAALVAGERRIPFQLRVEEPRDSRLGVRLHLQNGEEELADRVRARAKILQGSVPSVRELRRLPGVLGRPVTLKVAACLCSTAE